MYNGSILPLPLRSKMQPAGQSSPRPLRELFLALCCFLPLSRRSLSDFCLHTVSWRLDGSSEDIQVLDALGLFGRGLPGNGGVGGVYNGFVQPLVAALGVVALPAAIVGLDDDGAGAFSKMAGCPYLRVEGSGQVLQECMERHL